MLVEDLSHLSGQSESLTTPEIVGDIGSAGVMLLPIIVAQCTLQQCGMPCSSRVGK